MDTTQYLGAQWNTGLRPAFTNQESHSTAYLIVWVVSKVILLNTSRVVMSHVWVVTTRVGYMVSASSSLKTWTRVSGACIKNMNTGAGSCTEISVDTIELGSVFCYNDLY